MNEALRILSFGGGTQSSALLHMSIDGVLPKVNAAIFADTKNEMDATYTHVEYMRQRAESAGIPFLVVSKGNLYDDAMSQRWPPTLPCTAINERGEASRVNRYTCSYDYKRRIVTAQVRRLCGGRGAWRNANVEQWIGYTTDEASRMKQADECRCGHKRAPTVSKRTDRLRGHENGACRECKCERFEVWQTNAFPLITQMQMRKSDAIRWMTERGYPEPPRSACWFCPNRGNSHWRGLRERDPEKWAKSVALDEHQRTDLVGRPNVRLQARYLHGSAVPLAEADIRSAADRAADEGQDGLFDDELVAMDCDLGVCFT